MGAFVLGILAGWLLEWLFFNYWIKGRSTGKFADCSGLKLELSAKNKEISALKTELENTEKFAQEKIVDTATTANSEPIKKSAPAKKSASSAAESKKISEKKSTKPKASTSSKKSTAKSEKDTSKKLVKKVAKKTWDDFTKLSGIGPSISAKLNELGISTYQKLSEMDDDILRDMLEGAGARMNNNKEVMHTWNEQAALAAMGDFEGLKKLQESIKDPE